MAESSARAQAQGDGSERWFTLLKNVAFVVTILGAIPTAITAYHAYTFGVPFTQVPQRLAQYNLWIKNIDCKIQYKALATTEGTKIDVGACPVTRDIALKVSAPDGKAAYQWIAYDELQKPGEPPPSHGLLDLLISKARAETALPAGSFRVAQGMEVVCQAVKGNNIVRVIKEGDKCVKEVVDPIRGTVSKREDVSCSASCG
jgi:hypothetical protein